MGGKRSYAVMTPWHEIDCAFAALIRGLAARQDRPSLTITHRRDVDPHVLQLKPCAEAAEDLPRPVEILPSLAEIALRDRHWPKDAPRRAGTEHEATAFGHGHCALRGVPRLGDIAEAQPGVGELRGKQTLPRRKRELREIVDHLLQ